MLDSTALLGVARSVTGRRWLGPSAETERLGLAVAQRAGVPELLGRVLAGRGVAPAEAAAYLDPTLRDLMPDPSRLADMDRAADRLARAVRSGEPVAVFGDYDVDGAASAAMLRRWLGAFSIAATVYIPDRVGEGYGPNAPAMRALAARHPLIVCVDCGSQSAEAVAAAEAAGAEVLIADHHLCPDPIPPRAAVVNPNRPDCGSGLGHLCAAGVVFLLLVAANRALRAAGVAPPDALPLLDLVALATVADVAPLTGLNRAFVRQGLRIMAQRRNGGLAALADVARLSGRPSAFHLGYLLGPRINAGGRIGDAALGARLLSTDDPAEATALAQRLDALNVERKGVEAAVLDAALAQAAARGIDGPLVWAAGEDWAPGVVGIVAGRLRETFDRPAVVIGFQGAEGRGSGRSTPGVDLGAAVATLAREGFVSKGGGHRMAAGLSLAPAQVETAMARLGALLAAQGSARGGGADLALDGLLAPAAATLDLCDLLEAAGPWGQGAPAPRFALAGLRLASVAPAGERHLRATLTDGAGGRIEAIAFRAFEGPLGPFLMGRPGGRVHVAGRIEADEWRGARRPKLRIEDAAPAEGA